MYINLENKVIVLTGASGIIGNSISKVLLSYGAKLVLQYNSNMPTCVMNNKTNKIVMVKADITKYCDVKNVYFEALNEFEQVDVLINNAGIEKDASIDLLDIQDWNNVINTNLTGTFYCCKVFSEIMKNQNHGKIINISSIKGLNGSKFQSNYSASKAGVLSLTKSLAKELGDYNISVNSVCPAFIKTNLNNYSNEKFRASEKSSVLKRKNTLHTLNRFIAFMCSDDFDGVSGQNFILDSRII